MAVTAAERRGDVATQPRNSQGFFEQIFDSGSPFTSSLKAQLTVQKNQIEDFVLRYRSKSTQACSDCIAEMANT